MYLRFSFSQISSRRSSWIRLAKGLKRNLEHLEVRGSIILENTQTYGRVKIFLTVCVSVCVIWALTHSWPAYVVTDETEAGGARLLLHGPSEGGLSWSRHGVGLVQDDDLKGRTRLPAAKAAEQRIVLSYNDYSNSCSVYEAPLKRASLELLWITFASCKWPQAQKKNELICYQQP